MGLGLVGVDILRCFLEANEGGRDANTRVRAPGPQSVRCGRIMARTLNSTPLNDGFAMPAEFAPHAGCWMLWPERPDNWRAGAQPAQRAFAEIAAAIARFEPVTVGVSASHF